MSNDGNLWSMAIPLFIFDGNCLTCTTQGMRCEIKVGKYKQHSGITYCKLQQDKKDSCNDLSADFLPILYRYHQCTRFLLRFPSAIVGFKVVFKETVVGE